MTSYGYTNEYTPLGTKLKALLLLTFLYASISTILLFFIARYFNNAFGRIKNKPAVKWGIPA